MLDIGLPFVQVFPDMSFFWYFGEGSIEIMIDVWDFLNIEKMQNTILNEKI